jgi:hypothetical protein
MKASCFKGLVFVGAWLLILPQNATAQQAPKPPRSTDIGKLEYESRCATCHGETGKGDGPTAAYLTRQMPDLTDLAKRNNGILPVSELYDIIDGLKEIPGHGTRELPVWGTAYRVEAGEYYGDTPYDPEVYVRARVLALVEYISRLQEK